MKTWWDICPFKKEKLFEALDKSNLFQKGTATYQDIKRLFQSVSFSLAFEQFCEYTAEVSEESPTCDLARRLFWNYHLDDQQ